jgi:hypothetical protein
LQGEGLEKKQANLCSDKVAERKGWHDREIKLKESKREEDHVALGVESHIALG